MRTIFVTGIGTDVGKTVISAMLVEALRADYFKPVQTGAFFTSDAKKIQKYITNPVSRIHPESYSLGQYMSPHAAAEQEGVRLELSKIVLPETDNPTLIVEGAGGIMVPLNEDEFMVDVISKFDAEVVLVIQNYLGSINHSLLSLDALKFRNLKLLGIVFNGAPHQMSEDIIIRYSGSKMLGRVYKEVEINKEVVLKYVPQFSKL
ncbi:MAG TPA: dethiobiotin synthase [Bacteroidia bacterium]|jgi:dethiobiotin synthetase|nr:dethiobiotin synthase [Bacteroidia bacterium]